MAVVFFFLSFSIVMMIPRSKTVIGVVLALAFSSVAGPNALASVNPLPLRPTEVRYLEVTGKAKKIFSWQTMQQEDGSIVVVLEEKNIRFENVCRKTGETIAWRYQDAEQTQLSAKREGNTIIIHGVRLGKPVDKVIEIDDRPWYQPLSFSLQDFLNSDRQQTSFWTIRVNNLDAYALKAKKLGDEKIDTVAGAIMAKHVEIRVEGILSGFWQAAYWYRQEDGLFLRYRSVHGAAGTDATEITIASATAPANGSLN